MFLWVPLASAQPCSEPGMRLLINDLQRGREKWPFLSPPLAQAIMAQTGGTGQYSQLAQLGNPVSVQVIGGQPLPNGWVCVYRTQFQTAALDWQVASGMNLLQAVSFQPSPVSGIPVTPPPGVPSMPPSPPSVPIPSGGGGGTTSPNPGSVPSTTEACKLYPNLC